MYGDGDVADATKNPLLLFQPLLLMMMPPRKKMSSNLFHLKAAEVFLMSPKAFCLMDGLQ